MSDQRLRQQQQAIDSAVAKEKRKRARQQRDSKPLGDRTRRAAPPTPHDWLLRDHAAQSASVSQKAVETVEQWMARTGQAPEALPPDAISGLPPTFNNSRNPRT